MSARPVGAGALLMLALLLPGCSDDPAGRSAAGSAAASGSPAPLPTPVPAGPAEAAAVAGLPDGPASGSVLVQYSGLGELRAPFSGSCATDGGSTTLSGTADTARLELTFDPGGAWLALDDLGLVSTSSLGRGGVEVVGPHLTLQAPLSQEGQVIGSIELDLDCAG